MTYEFEFAGQILKGEYLGKDLLNDNTIVYIFTDGKYKYPIKRNKICGHFKQ
jgi:hypothetical protein